MTERYERETLEIESRDEVRAWCLNQRRNSMFAAQANGDTGQAELLRKRLAEITEDETTDYDRAVARLTELRNGMTR